MGDKLEKYIAVYYDNITQEDRTICINAKDYKEALLVAAAAQEYLTNRSVDFDDVNVSLIENKKSFTRSEIGSFITKEMEDKFNEWYDDMYGDD